MCKYVLLLINVTNTIKHGAIVYKYQTTQMTDSDASTFTSSTAIQHESNFHTSLSHKNYTGKIAWVITF